MAEQLQGKAGDHEWGLVAEIEARRSELVARCFQQPAQQQHAGEVAAAIREILQLNRKISDLGERYREQLGSEIHSSKLGRTASAAYLGCGC